MDLASGGPRASSASTRPSRRRRATRPRTRSARPRACCRARYRSTTASRVLGPYITQPDGRRQTATYARYAADLSPTLRHDHPGRFLHTKYRLTTLERLRAGARRRRRRARPRGGSAASARGAGARLSVARCSLGAARQHEPQPAGPRRLVDRRVEVGRRRAARAGPARGQHVTGAQARRGRGAVVVDGAHQQPGARRQADRLAQRGRDVGGRERQPRPSVASAGGASPRTRPAACAAARPAPRCSSSLSAASRRRSLARCAGHDALEQLAAARR